ncbi:MAG: FkbM family methyltransferase [Parachlamydiaceae bacterium]
MHLKRRFAALFLAIIGIAFIANAIATPSIQPHEAEAISPENKESIFLGIIIKNDDCFIPTFLRSIDRLDYNKKLITLQIDHCNTSPESFEIVKQWIANQQNNYQNISFIDHKVCAKITGKDRERMNLLGEIKNHHLAQAQQKKCDHCLIVESDTLLAPYTLKELLKKNKPVISPLLRPIPEANDPFRNFYADATEEGYYKEHADYWAIADRAKLGTFKVPCVQIAYLIQSNCIDKLSFTDNEADWEFIAFAKNANHNKVDQFICNEKEFGSFLHFREELSEEEEKQFTLAKENIEITPTTLNSLFASYFAEDPLLEKYIKNFDYTQYALYRVKNRDLYYVDENYDWIKSCFIKKCAPWEENIHAELKKYTKPGTTAIDIGGHMGTHTLNLSRLVGENGSVHVFEPRVKMFTELVINMNLNDCKNISFHRRALGNENRQVTMYIPQPNNEGMACIRDSAPDSENETAKMERLDDYHLSKVSIIKMDVEGFEMEVIKGGLETILRNKPVMLIEIFQGPDNLHRIHTIESLGYTHFHLFGDDYLFLPNGNKS